MTMRIIAIDGACYHNGKPDSYCVGACLVFKADPAVKGADLLHITDAEEGGTNQRGELLGLFSALSYIALDDKEDWLIITDSEYILNAMRNEWTNNWVSNNWTTATGEPVKNRDLWEHIHALANEVQCEISYQHIKGHVVPFGEVTRRNMLNEDETGETLLYAVAEKFDAVYPTNGTRIEEAQKCSERNNYCRLPYDTLRLFVSLNTVADAMASQIVDEHKASISM